MSLKDYQKTLSMIRAILLKSANAMKRQWRAFYYFASNASRKFGFRAKAGKIDIYV